MDSGRLHAYWRMPYITAPQEPADGKVNPFLKIPEHPDPREALLLYRSEHAYLALNKFPYNAGHLLAVPYVEIGDPEELPPEVWDDLNRLVLKGKKLLRLALRPDGFNIGYNIGRAAGAGIPSHLHCHIVPRWSGDNNMMPVIANTRVLPEAMEAMYDRLAAFVHEIS